MKEKLAIVTNGGGARCAYSAGALCALAEVHSVKNPDIVVGSSGSTGSLAYYVAGQYSGIKNIWTNLLASKKFVSFKRINRILDVDYVIKVFKDLEPLDYESVRESKTDFFISATEYATGKKVFFDNHQDVDIFEAMRASKAVPLFYGKKVAVNGVEYIDGSIAAPMDKTLEKAVVEGAKSVIMIDDDNSGPSKSAYFWKAYSLFVNKKLRKVLMDYSNKGFLQMDFAGVNIATISPSRKLNISPLDSKREHLKDTFDLGYNDTKSSEELKRFVKTF